ncbi:hypothetical protein TBR22_A44870 [Luteitalea sp. TBR-22]|uniref:C40 family peptidase n=1 Tax=Luteitalea sp. TBR-22 TaxID=2802971 RepID=UPI001AF636AB|nr:C40 family peptidase [Luteitalea sp. TBR-22]BCS35260.1 hypothetical protein TBR22_A44870 [Luteitalea sp. TBR-22]
MTSAPRPAAALRLLLLLALAPLLWSTGCASHGMAGIPVVARPEPTMNGDQLVSQARAYTGVAYRPGGATPDQGFDCSGFVQYLYAQAGIELPRTADEQFAAGRDIDGDLRPGDLVFFRTSGRRVSHVGIATGDGAFIHAPNARSRVRIDRLDQKYWASRFAGARRIVG